MSDQSMTFLTVSQLNAVKWIIKNVYHVPHFYMVFCQQRLDRGFFSIWKREVIKNSLTYFQFDRDSLFKKKQKQKQKDTQHCWSFHYFRVPQGYLINTGLGGSSFSRKTFEITRVLKLFLGKRTYTKLDCPVLLVSLILITKLFCQGGFYFTLFCSFQYEC